MLDEEQHLPGHEWEKRVGNVCGEWNNRPLKANKQTPSTRHLLLAAVLQQLGLASPHKTGSEQKNHPYNAHNVCYIVFYKITVYHDYLVFQLE